MAEARRREDTLVVDWFFSPRFRNARVGVMLTFDHIAMALLMQCDVLLNLPLSRDKRFHLNSNQLGIEIPISVNNIQNTSKIPGTDNFSRQLARQTLHFQALQCLVKFVCS